MAYIVSSPGSCGEFIQGYMNGSSFMVTCPINRFAYAFADERGSFEVLPAKAESAKINTLKYLGCPDKQVSILLKSTIRKGKGMASSTADISAVAQAAALCCGKSLSPREIADIALGIEPSDATFFEGVVQFDYREGRLIHELGHCPSLQILIYDCGGEIDTMQFNSRNDLIDLQKSNEKDIAHALELFKMGIRENSIDLIGKAATISAFANQKILYKKQLDDFYKSGISLGGKGVICAHSGTVLGLILPITVNAGSIRSALESRIGNRMQFLDIVEITNQGMQYRKGTRNDFDKL
ncbi:GHMP kinase [uncultured Dialister sp.]|uniref:GHMP family kinase ATP-binding protein n=1 Tax=uncultured Dialister sp. TaxID=278064 RepID=UPI0025F7847D|nr:GHMP kinase [uncultured Dialister sp.]